MQQAKKIGVRGVGGWEKKEQVGGGGGNRTDRCYLNDAGAHDTNKVFRTWLIADGVSKQ